jgi:cytochrome c-type protein NapB
MLRLALSLAFVAGWAVAALADELPGLRGGVPLTEEGPAPRMMPVEETHLRRVRNYPEQPPTIPHKIEGYQVDLNANRCLACHSRAQTGESQAPMVSITHFMDRDGQFLAAVSPRRYFCNQCHVPQHEVGELVGNAFVDVDTILTQEAEQQN